MVYMRHRGFLVRKHRYRTTTTNKYFDNKEEPQIDEPKKTRYGQKVFDMVKGIDVKFRKKKKEKDGTTTRESGIRWRNHMSPFLSRSSRVSSSTCRIGRS
jgi:hypothetical protein